LVRAFSDRKRVRHYVTISSTNATTAYGANFNLVVPGTSSSFFLLIKEKIATMGTVFGKASVAEPHFDVLMDRNHHVHTGYEIRKYGERFAATCSYDDADDMDSPFRALAGYIGVFGKAQNDGQETISMTAPVVIEGGVTQGEKIAMTAPVVMETNDDGKKVMKFMLPDEYDDLSKIPKPTNPKIHIEEIPPQVGVVHRYHGSLEQDHNQEMAMELADQLMEDGVEGITEEYMLAHFQFWGYNPPFTLPYFRRNEVWLQLTEDQVEYLMNEYDKRQLN
jgi:hypothetical protein